MIRKIISWIYVINYLGVKRAKWSYISAIWPFGVTIAFFLTGIFFSILGLIFVCFNIKTSSEIILPIYFLMLVIISGVSIFYFSSHHFLTQWAQNSIKEKNGTILDLILSQIILTISLFTLFASAALMHYTRS